MKRTSLWIIGIFLVVIMLGCITGPKKDERAVAGPGIVIKELKSDFPSIDAGEIMTVAMSFENRGDFEAKEIEGELVRQGAFTVSAGYVGGSNTILEPPIGDTYSADEFYWDIEAPKVSQDRLEEVQARLYYNYQTEGYATIHFVPREILREQGAETFPLDASSTRGPIGIEIAANQPIIVRDSDVTFKVTVILTNDGTGRAESKSTQHPKDCTDNTDCIDSLKIKGFGPDPCGDIDKQWDDGVKLVQGQEARKTITHTFDINDLNKNAATSCQLKVTAKYGYRQDSKVLPIEIKSVD